MLSEYLFSAVIVALIASFLSYISYPSQNDTAVKAASALLILYTLISPVSALISSLYELSEKDSIFDTEIFTQEGGEYLEVSEEAFKTGIKRYISDEFDTDEKNIEVVLSDFKFTEMRAEHISVYLSGSALLLDRKKIEEKLNKLNLGKCEVFWDIG